MPLPPELAADEISRLSLLATVAGNPAAYQGLTLTSPAPGYTPDDDAGEEISLSDIEEAVTELAARRGEDYGTTFDIVRALAGGERTVDALMSGVVALATEPHAAEMIGLTDVSWAERQEYARRGWALPDGSYPIGNRAQLHAAAVLYASGHGDVKAAGKLIRKRAGELGVPLRMLPGFGHEASAPATIALTADDGEVELSAGFGSVDDIARRNPELFRPEIHHVGAVTSGKAIEPNTLATTRNRAHKAPEEDITDTRQPSRGGVVHPDVDRYVDMIHDPRFMGGKSRTISARETPHGSVVVHPYRGGRR
jgi:hypothetical protein